LAKPQPGGILFAAWFDASLAHDRARIAFVGALYNTFVASTMLGRIEVLTHHNGAIDLDEWQNNLHCQRLNVAQ
jgi:hypothetical protein